jgi:hypothetical protein
MEKLLKTKHQGILTIFQAQILQEKIKMREKKVTKVNFCNVKKFQFLELLNRQS